MSASPEVTVNVLYYSMYGHVRTLVDATVAGLREGGVKVNLLRVPELLPEEVLKAMHAAPQDETVPLADRETWVNADGFVFAAPTRFGTFAAPMKAWLDGAGGHWQKGSLMGKPVTFLTSTGTQNGGQETTHLTAVPFAAHMGMVYVPGGYLHPKLQFDNSYSHGGSPYGASTLAGPTGAATPHAEELEHARQCGLNFAKTAMALKLGRAAMASAATGGAGATA